MTHPQESQQAYPTRIARGRAGSDYPVVPTYRVGEPFRRGHRSWPEGVQYHFGPGGHCLTLFQAEISADVVDDVRRGPAEFALIVVSPLIVLAYRFGETIPWQDIPYCWHLHAQGPCLIPPAVSSPEARSLLWVTMVGARDGLIHAQRGMTLSPPFTRALHESIRAQAMTAFDPEGCTLAISSFSRKYPRTVDRLPMAAARTLGNA
jgi:hypothetical protein